MVQQRADKSLANSLTAMARPYDDVGYPGKDGTIASGAREANLGAMGKCDCAD